MKQKTKILLFFLLCNSNVFAQPIELNFGAKVGLSMSLGTHANRIGFQAGVYSQFSLFQIHVLANGFFNKKSYGYHDSFKELQLTEGVNFCFGKLLPIRNTNTYFFNSNTNFSYFSNLIGYSFKQYKDRRGTAQTTAIIHFTSPTWGFAIEDDAFLFSYLDKFRTGGVSVYYFQTNQNAITDFMKYSVYSINLQFYTGDVLHKKSVRKFDNHFKARHGYMDMNDTPEGNYSEGIFSVGVQTSLFYNQNASVSVGIDDEHIRNFIQNKLIHDMPFLPKKWDKFNNPHVPMLQKNRKPFLKNKDEQVQPSKLYFEVELNKPLFY